MKNRDEGMVKTYHRKKLLVSITCVILALLLISIRLLYVCVFQSSYYLEKAQKLHERERDIKALRGEILDRNGVVLASNKTVCTVSVIHSQITQPQEVIQMLVKELDITEEAARKRVEKVSSIERVKTNVDKETGDRIREYKFFCILNRPFFAWSIKIQSSIHMNVIIKSYFETVPSSL